ncbi:MAG: FAD-dependent oxidoreductase, partial [Syntrophales bacterium]|nr:FAD-dependent oxidoreductase [Syntrophales bacterium]
MTDFDIVVVGAGVVGLAVAARLGDKKRRIVVLEKNVRYGQETSARNSEVIHSGIYYPSTFLKTRLCIAGRRLLYPWCQRHRVPHLRVGKIIVATTEEEMAYLEALRLRAEENGVEGIRWVGSKELTRREPEVRARGALYAPETGILDSHSFMRSLLGEAEARDVILSCRSRVTAVHFDGKTYTLTVNGGDFQVRTDVVINSAGLWSDRIAQMAGMDIDRAGYCLKYCKGDYFQASPPPRINHLIYP